MDRGLVRVAREMVPRTGFEPALAYVKGRGTSNIRPGDGLIMVTPEGIEPSFPA